MTGEMNIITECTKMRCSCDARRWLVDQALVVNGGIVQRRTVNVGFRTLDFSEALSGLKTAIHVIVSDQDKFHSGQAGAPAHDQRAASAESAVTPPLYIALLF